MTEFLHFPPSFTWGAATASYQIEGGWNEDGKGESVWDRFSHTPGKVFNGDTGDVACDHYHRWREDVELMKSLGLKAYRFSLSWARILPQGRGEVNQAGLNFYSNLVDALLEAGITPFITLFHWDLPQALQDEGGWANRNTALAFAEYADVVSKALGDRVKHWITHNEPSVVTWLGYLNGIHAPGVQDLPSAVKTAHHLLLSHGWAVPLIRHNSPQAEVGITLNINWTVPGSNSRADRDLHRQGEVWTRWFFDPLYGFGYPSDLQADLQARGAFPTGMDFVQAGDMHAIQVPTDFVGLNYYQRQVMRAGEEGNEPQTAFPQEKTPQNYTEFNWENYGHGLFGVLSRVYFHYLPPKIYVTENGASYSAPLHDELRTAYLQSHLSACQRALQAGIPLEGYFVWSLMDNFEWAEGYRQRFGITWVNFETGERTLKDSGKWYAEVIRRNGLEATPAPQGAIR